MMLVSYTNETAIKVMHANKTAFYYIHWIQSQSFNCFCVCTACPEHFVTVLCFGFFSSSIFLAIPYWFIALLVTPFDQGLTL